MKRIKIMLMSLLVLAVVGGTLAFKAKFGYSYCTSAAPAGLCRNEVCPNLKTNIETASGNAFCTTTPRGTTIEAKRCKIADDSNIDLACTTTKVNLPDND